MQFASFCDESAHALRSLRIVTCQLNHVTSFANFPCTCCCGENIGNLFFLRFFRQYNWDKLILQCILRAHLFSIKANRFSTTATKNPRFVQNFRKMEEFDEMLKQYPQMILTAKAPTTWKGFVTVTNNITNLEKKVKLKIIVPMFPNLEKASVLFGGGIAILFGPKFKKQLTSLLSNSESVPSFLQELIKLIEKMLSERENKPIPSDIIHADTRDKLLRELEAVLTEYSEVELSSTKDLSAIKLSMNDISMIVEPTINSSGQNSWKIISSDLPDLLHGSNNEKKSYSLKDMKKIFQKQVEDLEEVWEQLRKIDHYCWVTDPINPKPHHLYRRIYLSPSLSILLTLNPLEPLDYPKIKFLGANEEVEKYRDKMVDEDSIDKWDVEYSVHENLLTLLGIDEFPQAPEIDELVKEDGIVGDEECCICFSLESENGDIPDEICMNQKCRRRFHTTCLSQWLQEIAANKIVFSEIFGPCPNCGEETKCKLPDS